MTYDEVKKLLEDMRAQERLCLRIEEEIKNILGIYITLGCPSGYPKETMPIPVDGGGRQPYLMSLERLNERLGKRREVFVAELTKKFDLEDKLAEAIQTLTPVQQEIIVGYYMHNNTHYKLANACGYCDRQIKRIKREAINKIARIL